MKKKEIAEKLDSMEREIRELKDELVRRRMEVVPRRPTYPEPIPYRQPPQIWPYNPQDVTPQMWPSQTTDAAPWVFGPITVC